MFDVIPINGQTWLICGGRDFTDRHMFNDAIDDLVRMKGSPERIIHGGARGADYMAKLFAQRMALEESEFKADWATLGNAAGPVRNQQMIDQKPDFVVAFPGGRGTADMVRKARAAKIDVAEIKPK